MANQPHLLNGDLKSMNPEEEPKYTIEQIELLRRLKTSGLTKYQVLHALESMDRIEKSAFATTPMETSTSHSLPTISEAPKINSIAPSINSIQSVQNDYLRSLALQQTLAAVAMANNHSLLNPLSQLHHNSGSNSSLSGNFANPQSQPPTSSPPTSFTAYSGSIGTIKRTDSYYNPTLGDPSETNDDDKELIMLQAMPVFDTKEEIKNFMLTHGIKQHQVAEKTGVSQSYISQFLHQGVWMKDSTRTNIYKWYLAEKRKREGVNGTSSPPFSTSTTAPALSSAKMYMNGNNGTPRISQFKKRDRFVWKDSCVSILEQFYQENSYPDDLKREEIAQACNNALELQGQFLNDEKLVTSVKVYNWFANRRKEIKRKQQLELEQNVKNEPSPNSSDCGDSNYESGVSDGATNCQDPISAELDAVNHSIMALVNPSPVQNCAPVQP